MARTSGVDVNLVDEQPLGATVQAFLQPGARSAWKTGWMRGLQDLFRLLRLVDDVSFLAALTTNQRHLTLLLAEWWSIYDDIHKEKHVKMTIFGYALTDPKVDSSKMVSERRIMETLLPDPRDMEVLSEVKTALQNQEGPIFMAIQRTRAGSPLQIQRTSEYQKELLLLFRTEFVGLSPGSSVLDVRHGKRTASMVAATQRIGRSVLQYSRRYPGPERAPLRISDVDNSIPAIFEPCHWLSAPDRGELPHYLWDIARARVVETASLGKGSTELRYGIVSHTWGRWRKPGRGIVLPGAPLWRIPENTRFDVTALPRMLRKAGFAEKWVWLDLLCIPQDTSDPALASVCQQEIARQAAIFRRADTAVAWLNDISDWADGEAVITYLGLFFLRFTDECLCCGDKNCNDRLERLDDGLRRAHDRASNTWGFLGAGKQFSKHHKCLGKSKRLRKSTRPKKGSRSNNFYKSLSRYRVFPHIRKALLQHGRVSRGGKRASRTADLGIAVPIFTEPRDMTGWFSSLWTLQESMMRPDMIFLNKQWEPLVTGARLAVTLGSLSSLAGAFDDYHCVSQTAEGYDAPNNEVWNLCGRDRHPLTLWCGQPEVPRSCDGHSDVFPEGLLEFRRYTQDLKLKDYIYTNNLSAMVIGETRACTHSRAEAIMAVTDASDWFLGQTVEQFQQSQHAEGLVLGVYPWEFVNELYSKEGASFFLYFSVAATLIYSTVDGEVRVTEVLHGTMLPFMRCFFGANNDTSMGATMGSLVDSEHRRLHGLRDHSSVSGWRIEKDGKVLVPSVSIVASNCVAIETNLAAMMTKCPVYIHGNDPRETQQTFSTRHRQENMMDWLVKFEGEVHAVCLLGSKSVVSGIIIHRLPGSDETPEGVFVKAGVFTTLGHELEGPAFTDLNFSGLNSTEVNWWIL